MPGGQWLTGESEGRWNTTLSAMVASKSMKALYINARVANHGTCTRLKNEKESASRTFRHLRKV